MVFLYHRADFLDLQVNKKEMRRIGYPKYKESREIDE